MPQKSPLREYTVSFRKLDLPASDVQVSTFTLQTDTDARDPRLQRRVARQLWFRLCEVLPTDTIMVVWGRSRGQPVDWIGERISFDRVP